MSHCPWTYRAISISGDSIIPCCKFQGNIEIKQDIEQEFKYGAMNVIRQRLDSGEKIPECSECWSDEARGVKSFRQKGIDDWGVITEPEIRYVEYDLDNTCNLKCISCSSNNSSAWLEDEKRVYGQSAFIGRKVTEDYKNIDLTKLDTVKFFGGEPLLSKNISKVCEDLRSAGNIDKLTVYTNTNVTVMPKSEVEYVWLNCQQLNLSLSIDGIGDLHNFIRHGVDWTVIENNLKYFDSLIDRRLGNTNIIVHVTAYIYNINKLHEIRDFLQQHFSRFILDIEPLYRPKFLSIINTPKDFKLQTISYLKQHGFDSIVPYLTYDDDNMFDYFIEAHRRLVKLRNVDFKKINPELDQYIEQYPTKPIETQRLFELRLGHD